jgi:hypothetical protein
MCIVLYPPRRSAAPSHEAEGARAHATQAEQLGRALQAANEDKREALSHAYAESDLISIHTRRVPLSHCSVNHTGRRFHSESTFQEIKIRQNLPDLDL